MTDPVCAVGGLRALDISLTRLRAVGLGRVLARPTPPVRTGPPAAVAHDGEGRPSPADQGTQRLRVRMQV